MDGLGTQARQAARTQSSIARRERHHRLSPTGDDAPRSQAVSDTSSRAGCRHADAARRGYGADRQDGASAEPAALRCNTAACRRRLAILQPRVTPVAAGRPGRARLFQRVFSSARRSRSILTRSAVSDVYRDSVRGRVLSPARASTTSMRSRRRWGVACPTSRCSVTILFEGVFARAGLAPTSKSIEELPSRYDVVVETPASLGARRFGSCCPGLSGVGSFNAT